MAFKVSIKVGKGKNRSVMESIPLPNKKRVCEFIKRNPLVKSNTNIKVRNTLTKKTTTGKRAKFCLGRF